MRKISLYKILVMVIMSVLVLSPVVAKAQSTDNTVKSTTVKDINKLLKGWTYASSGSNTFNRNSTFISFEKEELVGKKAVYNRLTLSKWDDGGSFDNDINDFIKRLKQSGAKYNIKQHTSNIFEATNFDGLEFVYDYIIKTKDGYTVYEIKLDKVNEHWKHAIGYHEIPTRARMNEIEKAIPALMQKFKNYQFVDTLKNEPVMKAISKEKDWTLTNTIITGNVKTEYVPNGWTRYFEKDEGKYGIEINKTVISKQKYKELLKKFKNISTLTNSSKTVKAYRATQPISIVDNEFGGRTGDNRIIFVEKKGSDKIEYYLVYFDSPNPTFEQWNSTYKNESNKTFNLMINALIKANQ